MSLVAIANAVLGDPMVRRFHADPRVEATVLLLQERAPRHVPITVPRRPRRPASPRPRRWRRSGASARRTPCTRTRSS